MVEIYLDNASCAKPSSRVISAMLPFFTDFWGSIDSPHQKGQQLYPFVESAYRDIYSLFGSNEKDTFVLTSSDAESVGHVLYSIYQTGTLCSGKNQFVTSPLEDAPLLTGLSRLEKNHCVTKMIEINQGLITKEAVGDAITPRTALISLSLAHGLTGLVQPIAEIAPICKERGIPLHLDVTHALGKLYFHLDDLGASILTFNGTQLHAPKGIGGIYFREHISLIPWIVGGAEQGGYRAGEFDVPALIALGEAAKELKETRDYMTTEVARLRDKFEANIVARIPETQVVFQNQERLPHCSTILFPGIPNELMLYSLNRQGIYASIGGGRFQQIGKILSSCGIDKELAGTAVCFTLSRETTEQELEKTVELLVETAKKLRKISTPKKI